MPSWEEVAQRCFPFKKKKKPTQPCPLLTTRDLFGKCVANVTAGPAWQSLSGWRTREGRRLGRVQLEDVPLGGPYQGLRPQQQRCAEGGGVQEKHLAISAGEGYLGSRGWSIIREREGAGKGVWSQTAKAFTGHDRELGLSHVEPSPTPRYPRRARSTLNTELMSPPSRAAILAWLNGRC